MGFRGWPAEAIEFFEGLEADNTKTYWLDHKAVYDEAVKAPTEALLAEVSDEFGAGKIFRPNRDVRFSHDKSPYKTNIGAVTSGPDGAIYYVALSSEALFAGTGYYRPAPDQLARFREAVAGSPGEQLDALVAGLRAKKYEIGGEELKRAPRGYPPDHPRVALLRHKGLTVGRSFAPAAWMGTAKAKDKVLDVWRAGGPVNEWLLRHVGPSTSAN